MTHLDIINLLKKVELNNFELDKLFGISPKNALQPQNTISILIRKTSN